MIGHRSSALRLPLLPLLATACWLLGLAGCEDNGRSSRADARPVAESAGSPAPVRGAPPAVIVAMARGSVEVPGGLLDIGVPVDGVVASVAVQEGDAVDAGQVLVQLASEAQQQDLAMAEAELRLAQVRQQAQQARLPAAADLARRTAEAAAAGAVDAQLALDAERSRQEAAAAIAIARAETAVAQQKVRQARSVAGRLTVRAVAAGRVIRLLAQPGSRVAAASGRPLLTLLPARPLRIRAELNEAFLPRVTVGMRASIYLDGEAAASAGPGSSAANAAPATAATATATTAMSSSPSSTSSTVGSSSMPATALSSSSPPVASSFAAPLPDAKVVRLSPLFANSRLDDEAQPRGRTRVVDCFLEFDRVPPSLRVGQAVRVEFHE